MEDRTRTRRGIALLLLLALAAGTGTFTLLTRRARPPLAAGAARSAPEESPDAIAARRREEEEARRGRQALGRARESFAAGDAESAARDLAVPGADDPELAARVAAELAARARAAGEDFDLEEALRLLRLAGGADPDSLAVRSVVLEIEAKRTAKEEAARLLAEAQAARDRGDLAAAQAAIEKARGLNVEPDLAARIAELSAGLAKEADRLRDRSAVEAQARGLLDEGNIAAARDLLDRYSSASGDSSFADRIDALRRLEETGGADLYVPTRSALAWLAGHVDPKSGGFEGEPRTVCGKSECRDRVAPGPGQNGLALMALTAFRPLDARGEFDAPAAKLAAYLVKCVDARGEVKGSYYDSAIVALALLERVRAVPKADAEKEAAARILADLATAGRLTDGGWRYSSRDPQSDVSVTGWVLQAFHAGRAAGLEIPVDLWPRALGYLESMTDAQGRTGYVAPGAGSLSMTAVALYVRLLFGSPDDDPTIAKSSAVVAGMLEQAFPESTARKKPQVPSRLDEYALYYAVYAFEGRTGEPAAKRLPAVGAAVAARLSTEGHAAGSVDPSTSWERRGGRLYATALAALTMEAAYRHR